MSIYLLMLSSTLRHDCILSINLSPDFTKFGEVSGVDCPFDEKFVDCCVINHQVQEKLFKVVCMTESLSRLFFWMVSYDSVSPAKWVEVIYHSFMIVTRVIIYCLFIHVFIF